MANDPVAGLMAALKKNEIEYLRFEMADMAGVSRSKTVPIDNVGSDARVAEFLRRRARARHILQCRTGERSARRPQLRRSGAVSGPRLAADRAVARKDGKHHVPRQLGRTANRNEPRRAGCSPNWPSAPTRSATTS